MIKDQKLFGENISSTYPFKIEEYNGDIESENADCID